MQEDVRTFSKIEAITALRSRFTIEDGSFLIVFLIWITAGYKIVSILGYTPHGDSPYFMAWIINFHNGNFADPVNYGELIYYPPMLAFVGTVIYTIFHPTFQRCLDYTRYTSMYPLYWYFISLTGSSSKSNSLQYILPVFCYASDKFSLDTTALNRPSVFFHLSTHLLHAKKKIPISDKRSVIVT